MAESQIKHRYAILILDKIRLIKFTNKDEFENLFQQLENDARPYECFRLMGDYWSRMEQYR